MIWLSGGIRKSFDDELPASVGWMLQPFKGNNPTPGRWWAADNGCFARPEDYSDAWYLGWLMRHQTHQPTCLFATAPDVVGDAPATLERALPMLAPIRALGYRAALVAQEGLESLPVPWEAFDCLFIGGRTRWKLSEVAYGLMAEAKRRGKWVHVGRVNSLRRLRAMKIAGADSADGTFLAFGPDANLPRVRWWLDVLRAQPPLFTTVGSGPGGEEARR